MCAFDILIVGATSGRPPFIKISFCLKRTVEDAGPYRFDCYPKLSSVGEGLAPPVVYKNFIAFGTGSRGRLPLPICAIFYILIVGATIGRPREFKERPYGFDCFPKVNACRGGYYPPVFKKLNLNFF